MANGYTFDDDAQPAGSAGYSFDEPTQTEALQAAFQAKKLGHIDQAQQDSADRYVSGQQGLFHTLAQTGLNQIGKAGEAVGEVVAPIANGVASVFPGAVRDIGYAVNTGKNFVKSLPTFNGGTLGEEIPQELAQHPVLAGDLNAAKNAVNGVLAVTGAGELAAPALKIAGKGAAKVGSDIAGGLQNISAGVKGLDGEALMQAAQEMRSGLYNNPAIKTTVLNPDAGIGLAQAVTGIIPGEGTTGGKALYNKTINAVENLKADIAAGNLSLEDIDRHRQVLGNIGKDITNPNKAQEAYQAGRVIDALDDHLDTLGLEHLAEGTPEGVQALNQARAGYAQSKAYERIATLVQKSGGNAKKLQTLITNFSANPKNLLGLTDEEVSMVKAAGKPGYGQNALVGLGNLSPFQRNPTSAITSGSVLTGAHFVGATPLALTLTGAGVAARPVGNALIRGKVANILDTIEARGAAASELGTPKLTTEQLAKLTFKEQVKYLNSRKR